MRHARQLPSKALRHSRTTDFWEMIIDVEVRDVKHLTNVIAALRATPVINSAERARG